jgi:2-methylcitrate dehydratase
MDNTSQQLVSYTREFGESSLPETIRHATVRHLVDSMGCAVAGFDSASAQVGVRLAKTVTSTAGATVFVDGVETSPEAAAFANTIMIRTWDWNDGMLAIGGGHPSDMIAAILAVGESVHSSGTEVLTAITLAYELLGALGSSAPVRNNGWDQGTFMGVATALAVSKLLGLTEEQMGNAASLAVVPNIPLRVTRTGSLSMWKGSATASAVRNAIFAAKMAAEGMTGPDEPFEGKTALWDQVTGPFEVSLPAYSDGRYVVQLAHFKQFPAETHSLAFVGFAPTILEFAPIDDIESIAIETYWHAWHEIGMHPSRWDPQTRETADHSLPYLLAVALVDGDVNLDSFLPKRYLDDALRPVMDKISITENSEYTALFRPKSSGITADPRSKIHVKTHSGRELIEELGYPRGHANNPMTDEDINVKLDSTCRRIVDAERKEQLRDAWWNVEKYSDIGEPIRTMVGVLGEGESTS